jgi:glucose-1-phosphate thymidylyltransferase
MENRNPLKGVILAGGKGTRLGPLTLGVSKQLLPLFDKPMIYYPLATLMAAGIRQVCIIVNPHDLETFVSVLGNGSAFGVSIVYKIQPEPEGIPQALSIAEEFIGGDDVVLVLGDNLLIGSGLGRSLRNISGLNGAHIFLYQVENPQDYGNVKINSEGKIEKIVEKPAQPFSKFAIPGLYFFANSAVEKSKKLEKSSRGEYEIVDLLNEYLVENTLTFTPLVRGTVWLDTGTPEDLFLAGEYVRIIQKRQGTQVACLEEISILNGWLKLKDLENSSMINQNSQYGKYLRSLIHDGLVFEPLVHNQSE